MFLLGGRSLLLPEARSLGPWPSAPPLKTASVYWDTQIGIVATFK